MFTVKHVTPLGNEALYSAIDLTYSQTNFNEGVLWVRTNQTDPMNELRSGTAYVMNDAGSTVAVYRLTENFEHSNDFGKQTSGNLRD